MKIIHAVLLSLSCTLMLPSVVHAQNISEIAKSDPLIITGAVGTQNTYRYSSAGNTYGSPLSNTVYANLNISLYGISMPFSFYYSNDNLSFNYPHISFNISPTYKNWTGHIGQSTMAMSNYVMNMSWTGVGLEYNSDHWRAGAFYGRLRSASNPDPNDPTAYNPQFRRMGWGFKVGYGSGKNYIDLYFLRAYDCLNSVNEAWRDVISPEENIVVGLKGCVTPFRWMSFTANAAASVFSTNTQADKIESEEAQKWDKIFDVRYSTLARFAGDVNMNFMFSGLNASVTYRMVQPDYTSLGTYYMSNNYQSLGVSASTNLFRRIALSATFNGQRDNLTKNQMYTTSGYVYAANASTRIGKHFNITAGYNGYTQLQTDGSCKVNDSTRVNRQLSSFSLTPSYNIEGQTFGHTFSVSASYTINKDKNKFAEQKNDVTTKALGINYGLDIIPWETDVFFTASHQESDSYKSRYKSDIGSISVSRSFLKEKNLNVSGTVNMIYNEVERQSKCLSIGGDVSIGYTLKKVHAFSASASFNKYGDVNMTQTRSGLDCTDITASLNYTYTFSLLQIKSKAHKKAELEKANK